MTDIYSRFMALPRARKGTTTVVIVEESALAELIAAAQTSEAKLFGAQHATVGPPPEGRPKPPAPYAEHLEGSQTITVNVDPSVGDARKLEEDIRVFHKLDRRLHHGRRW